MGAVVRLTDQNFESEVLQAEIPVLVDFWASWCPPCKTADPVMKELAEQYEAQVKIGKLNVDQNPKTRAEYDVMGLPTFILFDRGKAVERKIGAQSSEQLRKMLSESLNLNLNLSQEAH